MTIIGKNKWEGLTASGNKESTRAYETQINYVRGVNAPVLAPGMKPIKHNGTTWVETTENDSEWYDYANKKWANARTKDGSMWVWIPRYIYKITSGWHSSSTGTIEVKFSISKGIDDTLGGTVTLVNTGSAADSNGTWTRHPAFTFDDTELTGIWAGKFESTAVEGVDNGYEELGLCSNSKDNVTTKTIKIISTVPSWRCITIDNAFTAVRKNQAVYMVGPRQVG